MFPHFLGSMLCSGANNFRKDGGSRQTDVVKGLSIIVKDLVDGMADGVWIVGEGEFMIGLLKVGGQLCAKAIGREAFVGIVGGENITDGTNGHLVLIGPHRVPKVERTWLGRMAIAGSKVDANNEGDFAPADDIIEKCGFLDQTAVSEVNLDGARTGRDASSGTGGFQSDEPISCMRCSKGRDAGGNCLVLASSLVRDFEAKVDIIITATELFIVVGKPAHVEGGADAASGLSRERGAEDWCPMVGGEFTRNG